MSIIDEYFRAEHDADAVTATFTTDGTVTDEGVTRTGHQEIRRWRAATSSQFRYTTTVLETEEVEPDVHLVTTRVAGDFPGSPVTLRQRFRLRDGLIADLVIAP